MKSEKFQVIIEFFLVYGWAILAAIIAIAVLAYFGWIPQESFIIYKNECHNNIIKFDDSPKEISKTIITKQFSMAGLEELDENYLINYFSDLKELKILNKNYDCSYSLIGDYKEIWVLQEFCPSVYSSVENSIPLIFYEFKINKIAGEGIRVYNGKVKNLRYDMNNISVSLDIIMNSLSFYKEQDCNQVEVDEIKYKQEVDSCQGLQIDINTISKMCGDSSTCITREIDTLLGEKNYYCLTECSNIDKSCKWFKVFNISKKDITKEWLIDNCEPIFYNISEDNGVYNKDCGYRSSDGEYVCKNNDCKNGQDLVDCIKKYKCFGDYFVEGN